MVASDGEARGVYQRHDNSPTEAGASAKQRLRGYSPPASCGGETCNTRS